MEYKLDRTAFSVNSHAEEEKTKVFKAKTYCERLEIAFYLNSIAYNFDVDNPPRLDKNFFLTRRRRKHL